MALPANYRQVAMLSASPITPNTPPTSSSSSTSCSLPPSSSTGGTTSSNNSSSSSGGGGGSGAGGSGAITTPATKPKERMSRPGGTGGGSVTGGKGGGSSSSSSATAEANVPSPFSTPVHGNPAFAPQKMGGGTPGSKTSSSSSDSRSLPKPPKGPDKPLMPYMRYSRKVWDQVKAANQDLKLWEIGKIIGSMWRDLPEADKQDFVDEYEAEKAEYQKNLEVYHQSAVYQQYVAAKAKAAASAAAAAASVKEESETGTDRAATGGTAGAAGATSGPVHAATKLDRRIDIQPAEDEEDYDDSVTLKHISHARYVRNHRLINEVFSDTMVPDVRSVVTAQRLTVLRRQVQSLTMHQKKLETELLQIEEKFDTKKRKFVEAGDSFQVELKKVKSNAPKLDDAFFSSLVERERETLKREAEERQRQQQQQQQTGGGGSGGNSPSTAAPPPEPSAGPSASNNATPVENTTEVVKMEICSNADEKDSDTSLKAAKEAFATNGITENIPGEAEAKAS